MDNDSSLNQVQYSNRRKAIEEIMAKSCVSNVDLHKILEVSKGYLWNILYTGENGLKFKAELLEIKKKSNPNAKTIGRFNSLIKDKIVNRLIEIGEI